TGGGAVNPAVKGLSQAQLQSWSVPTASTVTIDAATVIDASAKSIGDGGKGVVWSNEATKFAGTIHAGGGINGGNGGGAAGAGGGGVEPWRAGVYWIRRFDRAERNIRHAAARSAERDHLQELRRRRRRYFENPGRDAGEGTGSAQRQGHSHYRNVGERRRQHRRERSRHMGHELFAHAERLWERHPPRQSDEHWRRRDNFARRQYWHWHRYGDVQRSLRRRGRVRAGARFDQWAGEHFLQSGELRRREQIHGNRG